MRRATVQSRINGQILAISIHALLAESDPAGKALYTAKQHFYPRSPCGERRRACNGLDAGCRFLSTLSLRRATTIDRNGFTCKIISIHALLAESDQSRQQRCAYPSISIHALLAESDNIACCVLTTGAQFLSTLSLRRATSALLAIHTKSRISIHALLAESDGIAGDGYCWHENFYPRSPCGERPPSAMPFDKSHCISIHALLAESDLMPIYTITAEDYFYPRSPCGERQ